MENQNLNKKEGQNPDKDRTDLNMEEMGADQFDYGTGGPGAGRDDSSIRNPENKDEQRTMQSDSDTGAGVGSDE